MRGSFYRIKADRTVDDNAIAADSNDARGNSASVPEKAQRQIEAPIASSGVMAKPQQLCGVGEASIPSTPRSDTVAWLNEMIAGFVNLDVNGLRLQWRNHLGGTPPAHLIGREGMTGLPLVLGNHRSPSVTDSRCGSSKSKSSVERDSPSDLKDARMDHRQRWEYGCGRLVTESGPWCSRLHARAGVS